MAEHTVLKIVEEARAQPQHSSFDPVNCKIEEETPRALRQQPQNDHVTSEIEIQTPPAQPQQPPNDPVASEIEERINPELLRAIVNGDLILFKSILGIKEEAPIDIESIWVSNGGKSGLRGVTCGENTALHVVAGVMEKSSSTETFQELLNNLLPLNRVGGLVGLYPPLLCLILVFCWISFLIKSLRQTSLFVFSIKGIGKRIATALVGVPFPRDHTAYTFVRTYLQVVSNFLTVNPQWIREKKYELIEKARRTRWLKCAYTLVNSQRIQQKVYELIEKARRTRWLKWFFPLPNVSVLHKRRMYMEIAEIIYGQDPTLLNARNNATKETPLHCAAKAGKLHMVSLLVNFARKEGPQRLKAVLWARNQVGETALHEAARSGYSDVVKELLRADEYLTSLVENNGTSPVEEFFSADEYLTSLAENNGTSPVEELLGADENLASLVDENGISPLYLAVAAGCLDVVDMLIARNCQPSYAGPDEQTALHAAVMIQEEYITWSRLLEWNQSLAAITDKAGNTPLHYAALIGNTCAVRELLLKDTGPVYKDNLSGSFPVHLAAEADKVKVIKELLSMCPDVGELLDKEKRNFLHVAVEKKRKGVIMLACQERMDANVINAKDKHGNTPLHLAVIHSDSEIFALLSQNKRVNPNIRNKMGLTSLDISASLQDHQFTYSLNPKSIIHRALVTRGAFHNPCQPDLSKKVDDFLKARADCPNQREGKEMWNGVEVDIEKESTKYENMSKGLITGAVLIASATFVAIFTVSGVYKGNNSSQTWISRRNVFKAFVIADVLAFICAIVSTIWLLYSALSNFHLKYRKFYFQRCTPLLYGAINLFILTFGLGAYITIAPISEWLALLIIVVCGIAIISNIIWNPKFIPLINLAPYIITEELL